MTPSTNMSPKQAYSEACRLIQTHQGEIETLIGTLHGADQLQIRRELKKVHEAAEKPITDAVKEMYSPSAGIGAQAYRQERSGSVSWKKAYEALAVKSQASLTDTEMEAFSGKPSYAVLVEELVPVLQLAETPVWAAVDFETTGLSKSDRIIEIGIVRYDIATGDVTELRRLVDPEGVVSAPDAEAVHGLTAEALAGAPRWAEIEAEVTTFLDGTLLIAQNLPFEKRFFEQHGFKPCWAAEADTKVVAQNLVPGLKSYSLGPLAQELLGADREGRHHGALEDANLTLAVFDRLVAIAREQESDA